MNTPGKRYTSLLMAVYGYGAGDGDHLTEIKGSFPHTSFHERRTSPAACFLTGSDLDRHDMRYDNVTPLVL